MNMNMNEKGRQTRLLAAIAVLAMVVCAFAVVMPSGDVDGTTGTTTAPGDAKTGPSLSEVSTGVYNLTEDYTMDGNYTIAADVTIHTNGHTITTDNCTLTVNGTLYVDGTGGGLTMSAIIDVEIGGKVIIDNKGSITISGGSSPYIGPEGVVVLTQGTVEICDTPGDDGFTATLTEGSVATINNCPVWPADAFVNYGTVTVDGNLSVQGTFTNYGTMTISKSKTVTNSGTIVNNGTFTNNGTITNDGTIIDNSKNMSGVTNALSNLNVLGATSGILGTDGWTYDVRNKILAFNDATVTGYYFDGEISKVTVSGTNTISYNPAFTDANNETKAAIKSSSALSIENATGTTGTLTINMDVSGELGGSAHTEWVAAIQTSSTITIKNTKVTIDVDTADLEAADGYYKGVYGVFANGVTVGSSDPVANVELDISVTGSNLAFGISGGAHTYTNVTGKVHGDNRGIFATKTNLTFTNTTLTVSGGEKAIQAKDGSTVTRLVNSSITLELTEPASVNTGLNDRWGLKAYKISIDAESMLTTDGLRVLSDDSTVAGTLHVTYYDGAGVVSGNTTIFPAGLVLWDDTDDVPSGNAIGMTISDGGRIIVDANNAIAGKIIADDGGEGTDSSATFGALVDDNVPAHLAYTTVTSHATFSYGSLDVDGGFSGDTPILLGSNGEYDMSGTYDSPIEVGAGSSGESLTNVNVPSGRSAEFNDDVSLGNNTALNALGDVSGVGEIAPKDSNPTNISVTSSNPGALGNMLGGGLTAVKNETTAVTYESNTQTAKKFADLVGNNSIIILTANYEVSGTEELPSTVTVYLNGYNIIIGADDVLNVNGATIREGIPANPSVSITTSGTDGKIDVDKNGTFSLDGADVFAPVDADSEAYIVLQNTKSVTISDGQITSPIEVGYGNTINANSITVPGGLEINVYGTLNVNGTIRVNNGGEFNVHQGGEAVIAGTLNIAGTANVDGKMTVEGSVSMQGSGNSTSFAVGSTGTVDVVSGATFTVNRANGSYSNTLSNVSGGDFNVEGTLVMNGTLSGDVNDFGTVQINGTIVSEATVYIYDGVSITITSVTGGDLTITDSKAVEDYTDGISQSSIDGESDGNTVTLHPGTSGTIGGIIVSDSIESYIHNGVGNYFADMTVTGTVTSSVNGGTVTISGISGDSYIYNADGDTRTGQVHIGDMALGAGVILSITGGDVYVQGSIDATVAGNSITGVSSPTVSVSGGSVTVDGSIEIIASGISGTGYLNAAYYTTLEGVYTYHHYTSADAAMAAIDGADQKTVTLYGDVSVTTDASISSGENVIVSSGSTLFVEAVLTIEDGAYFTNNGTVEVKDTMIVTNHLATYNGTAPGADVMSTSGNDRTYMSLAAALESGVTSITLNRDVTIEGNVTVPEGVTVSGNAVDITVIPKVTLTVDGAIKLVRGDIKLVDGTAADGAMVVNGHVFVNNYAPAQETIGVGNVTYLDLEDVVDGAFFTKRVNGLPTKFVSSIEYAATAVDDSVTQITVYGNVTTTDVTFTAGRQGLTISVVDIDTNNQSSLTVGTMTLVGATLNLTGVNNGDITGTVTVQDVDGNIVGSIDADVANGFAFSAYQVVAADGTDNYAYISGAVEGDLEIVSGTVTVGPAADNTLAVNDDSTLTVGSGATLVLDSAMTVSAADQNDPKSEDALLAVDGTIAVNSTLTVNGGAVIAGTMDVTSDSDGSGTVSVNRELAVTGTLNVEAYSASNYGKVIVSGVMAVGSAPESLGVGGAVAGNIGIVSGGYVKAYAGADLSEAAFVQSNGTTYTVSTAAESTQYLINGVEYMTAYAVGGVSIYDVIDGEEFALSGIFNGVNFDDDDRDTGLYDIDNWFTDASMAANTVLGNEDIGDAASVYAKAQAATVFGTVSEGDGLTLYIDNVPISSSSAQYPLTVGTHTVAFTVQSGYDGSNASIQFNGQTVTSGGSIEITAGMETFTLTVTGATPADQTVTIEGGSGEMGLTDYLLIILVVLIVVMAIMVALRLMRS